MAIILDLPTYRLLYYSKILEDNSDSRLKEIFKERRTSGLEEEELKLMGFDDSMLSFIKENYDIWVNLARKQWKHERTIKKGKKRTL